MTSAAACHRCGSSLSPRDLPPGLCPACLMRLALAHAESAGGGAEGHEGGAGSHDFPPRIGPYRILSVLGEGGMGVVYLAEQEQPIVRTVALKVVKFGMDSREILARFDSERDLLAMMSHPNIARALDAGTSEDGRPYFVMEYVSGVPITEYCDANHLPIRERLALFIPVCRALQHAHQKAVIHRDLKPSNVLITIEDGRAVPKVIDFGIAKAIDQPRAERTAFTRNGVLLGTPEYMSPEQADGDGAGVDTTTDIYSLGVILYELLVGVLPFDPPDLRSAGYAAVLRVIRDEDPPRPSLRLTTLGAVTSEVERSRATDLPSLRRQLRGDLDWIVLRALEKDRTRRYSSASELAADIGRHLGDEPVMASPPGLLYRTGKAVRRHRAAVAALAAILLTLAAGLVTSTAMYLRAARAQRDASRQAAAAEAQSYLGNLAAAELLLREPQSHEAKDRLGAAPTDLRGWEWSYLDFKADESEGAIDTTEGAVNSLTWTPDGSQIIWLTERGKIGTIDAKTLATVNSRGLEEGQPNSDSFIAVARDGAASVSTAWRLPLSSATFGRRELSESDRLIGNPDDNSIERRTLTITNVASRSHGARLLLPSVGTSPALAAPCAVSMTRCRLGTELVGFGVHAVYDSAGRARFTMSGHYGSVVSAVFSDDTRRLATWTWDNVLRVWEVNSGQLLVTLRGHRDGITQAAFSPDGSRLASASHDGTVRIWSVADSRFWKVPLHTVPTTRAGRLAAVMAVAWSPDGAKVATGDADNLVRVWDRTGRLLATLVGHTGIVTALSFAPDGRTIVSGSFDRTVRCWDVATRQETAVLLGHTAEVRTIAVGPDGRRIASGGADGVVRVWQVPRIQPMPWPDDKGQGAWPGLAASAAVDRAAAVGIDGRLSVWQLGQPTPIPLQDASPCEGPIAMSLDGRVVAAACGDHNVRVWSPGRLGPLNLSSSQQGVTAIAVNSDGTRVAASRADKSVRVWAVATGRPLGGDLAMPGMAHMLSFSPNGRWLLAATEDSMIVWDADRKWSEQFRTDTKQGSIRAVAFSADCRQIATSSWSSSDHAIILWDTPSGRPIGTLTGQAKTASSIAFHPNGTRVVAGYSDGTAQVWDARSHEPLLSFAPAKSEIRCLQFSPDGTRILAVTDTLAFTLHGR